MKHVSAKASHYDYSADKYDAINEKFIEVQNAVIAKILKKHKVKSVLDLTCGTGSQVFYLAQNGFEVVGSDINQKMLAVAKKKAKVTKIDCRLFLGDMRTSRAGTFDSVITIFNAIGHLTKSDFKKALRNVHKNLRSGGIYVFDIFNLNYMLDGNNITNLTIDKMAKEKTRTVRKIQFSTIDHDGVLGSHTTSIVTKAGSKLPKEAKGSQTLQIYSASELKKMLEECGFQLISKSAMDGSLFSDKKTKQMLIVAKAV